MAEISSILNDEVLQRIQETKHTTLQLIPLSSSQVILEEAKSLVTVMTTFEAELGTASVIYDVINKYNREIASGVFIYKDEKVHFRSTTFYPPQTFPSDQIANMLDRHLKSQDKFYRLLAEIAKEPPS